MTENSRPVDVTSSRAPSADEIQKWLIAQLAQELEIPPDRIRIDRPILSYGIDSMQLVTIIAKLEDWLGWRFSSNPVEDHPTIQGLSQFVADGGSHSRSSGNDGDRA